MVLVARMPAVAPLAPGWPTPRPASENVDVIEQTGEERAALDAPIETQGSIPVLGSPTRRSDGLP
jgi:hypothetical protein